MVITPMITKSYHVVFTEDELYYLAGLTQNSPDMNESVNESQLRETIFTASKKALHPSAE